MRNYSNFDVNDFIMFFEEESNHVINKDQLKFLDKILQGEHLVVIKKRNLGITQFLSLFALYESIRKQWILYMTHNKTMAQYVSRFAFNFDHRPFNSSSQLIITPQIPVSQLCGYSYDLIIVEEACGFDRITLDKTIRTMLLPSLLRNGQLIVTDSIELGYESLLSNLTFSQRD